MKLTREEQAICKRYSAKDERFRVHCRECPLVIDKRDMVCKRSITKKEYKENYI